MAKPAAPSSEGNIYSVGARESGFSHSFINLSNEETSEDILESKVMEGNYFLESTPKRPNWKAGNIVRKILGVKARNTAMGHLVPLSELGPNKFIRGRIRDKKIYNGSGILFQEDLKWGEGAVKGDTYSQMKIMDSFAYRVVPQMVDHMAKQVDVHIGDNPWFSQPVPSTGVVLSTASTLLPTNGKVLCTHGARFEEEDKVILVHNDGTTVTEKTLYVQRIGISAYNPSELNTVDVTFTETRGSDTAYNFQTGAGAPGAGFQYRYSRFYYPDSQKALRKTSDNTDISGTRRALEGIKEKLFTSADGGATNIYGVEKAKWKVLQAFRGDMSWVASLSGNDNKRKGLMDAVFEQAVRLSSLASKIKELRDTEIQFILGEQPFYQIVKRIQEEKGQYDIFEKQGKMRGETRYDWSAFKVKARGTRIKFVTTPCISPEFGYFGPISKVTKLWHAGSKLVTVDSMAPDGNTFFHVRDESDSNEGGHKFVKDCSMRLAYEFRSPMVCGYFINIPKFNFRS